jgi:hypothetical protein
MVKQRRSIGEATAKILASEARIARSFLKITTQTKRKLTLDAKVRMMQTLSLRGSMIAAIQSSFKTKSLCSLFYLTNQNITTKICKCIFNQWTIWIPSINHDTHRILIGDNERPIRHTSSTTNRPNPSSNPNIQMGGNPVEYTRSKCSTPGM